MPFRRENYNHKTTSSRMGTSWFALPGAQNIPDLLADSGKMPPVSPSQEEVVICMTGHRSPLMSYALEKEDAPGSTISPGGWRDGRCLSGSLSCRARGTAEDQVITRDYSARWTAGLVKPQPSGLLALPVGQTPPRPVIGHPGWV